MTADDAVAQLVADPVAFLEFNALTIGGGATLDSGKRIFNLCLLSKTAKFSVQGKDWSRVATVRWWRAQVTRDDPQRALKSYKKGDDYYAEVLAYYVAMKQVG
ncbi:MAG TPA: hypothetical protein VFR86_31230, partial [Burkholderiaceae bacterium]|nr:hypothetical protein [Burkholderiaceae bacterium]